MKTKKKDINAYNRWRHAGPDRAPDDTQADKHKDVVKKHPWKHNFGGFLANSMKEQSMIQNGHHVTESVGNQKFHIQRNFSSVDFVIKPGNDGFSNYKQSPSNDS